MITDYRENLLTNVMNKFGFDDVFNKNTPVVIKQDFIVNEYSLLKAGTIGYINKVKSYDVEYKKEFAVCHLTLSTPKHGDIRLFCKIFDETDSVRVFGLKGAIEFKELIEIADKETSRIVEEYEALRDDYENAAWSYDNKTETASYICFAIAAILFVVGIISWPALANMILGISTISLAAIIALVGAVLYFRGFNDTKKGKTLNAQIEALADDITKKDEELCKDKRMFKVYTEGGKENE